MRSTSAIGNFAVRYSIALATRFDFILSDARQFRIGEHAEGDQAIAGGAIAAADVLAGQAGDVGTGATEQLALDNHCSTTAVVGPCGKSASDSAADDQVVILLNVGHLIRPPYPMSR